MKKVEKYLATRNQINQVSDKINEEFFKWIRENTMTVDDMTITLSFDSYTDKDVNVFIHTSAGRLKMDLNQLDKFIDSLTKFRDKVYESDLGVEFSNE